VVKKDVTAATTCLFFFVAADCADEGEFSAAPPELDDDGDVPNMLVEDDNITVSGVE